MDMSRVVAPRAPRLPPSRHRRGRLGLRELPLVCSGGAPQLEPRQFARFWRRVVFGIPAEPGCAPLECHRQSHEVSGGAPEQPVTAREVRSAGSPWLIAEIYPTAARTRPHVRAPIRVNHRGPANVLEFAVHSMRLALGRETSDARAC